MSLTFNENNKKILFHNLIYEKNSILNANFKKVKSEVELDLEISLCA